MDNGYDDHWYKQIDGPDGVGSLEDGLCRDSGNRVNKSEEVYRVSEDNSDASHLNKYDCM